ncbi:MAG: hypothetical protein Q7S29_05810 [Candidatus Peribacter sp.]|nr:hypothetical protein [Candidatus Peribacter sp.]
MEGWRIRPFQRAVHDLDAAIQTKPVDPDDVLIASRKVFVEQVNFHHALLPFSAEERTRALQRSAAVRSKMALMLAAGSVAAFPAYAKSIQEKIEASQEDAMTSGHDSRAA